VVRAAAQEGVAVGHGMGLVAKVVLVGLLGGVSATVLVCGVMLSGAPENAAPVMVSDAGLQPTGNSELDELREFALKEPTEGLLQYAGGFLALRVSSYRNDAILWRGVDRICRAVLDNTESEHVTYGMAAVLIVTIESGEFPSDIPLKDHLPALRRLKARLRYAK